MGFSLGEVVGIWLGTDEGSILASVGDSEGTPVGKLDGCSDGVSVGV